MIFQKLIAVVVNVRINKVCKEYMQEMPEERKKDTQETSVSWAWSWCHRPCSRGRPLPPTHPASRGSQW
jgi:hypothetical protein